MADKILVVDETTGKKKKSTVDITSVGGGATFATDVNTILTSETGQVLINESGNVLINGT